jgi:hypothetical protein
MNKREKEGTSVFPLQEAEEWRKEEIQEKYEKEMEGLVDEVGEGKITMEFERREKQIEREKVRELGEEEEKKDEKEVVEKVQEKVVVEVPGVGGKRG